MAPADYFSPPSPGGCATTLSQRERGLFGTLKINQ